MMILYNCFFFPQPSHSPTRVLLLSYAQSLYYIIIISIGNIYCKHSVVHTIQRGEDDEDGDDDDGDDES